MIVLYNTGATMKNIAFFFFFLIISGCGIAPFASPVITGVIMWKEGEAQKYYNEQPKTIYRATKMALKDLKLTINSDKNYQNGHLLFAGDKDKFKIFVREVKPNITEVKIRVNFMGDKPFAELLYNSIDINSNTVEFNVDGKPVSKPSLK
ncbi:MAG: DUF3568 family protein [Neisseriaceae bacterium]|nr:MAG: DUF3568 family protein [Neisseriaceae bacterium]